MQFNLFKNLFISALLIAGLSQNSIAAPQCGVLFTNTNVSSPTISTVTTLIRKFQKVNFTRKEKSELSEIAGELGINSFTSHLDLMERISDIFEQKRLPAIKKAEKMAQIGLKIQNILDKRIESLFKKYNITYSSELTYKLNESMIAEQLKKDHTEISDADLKSKTEQIKKEYSDIRVELAKARYTLGEKIAKLEAFKASEFELVDSHAMNKPGYTLVSLSEYPEFAMSLAKRTDPPRPYGSGGVVSLPEYRDVVSNNLWLFTLAGHDLKHIHYANSHPLAMGSIFRATRSKNHLRYFLVAALYEGVDTVQYGFESALARHFSSKGNNLEEGLVFLASATREQLLEIAQIIGVSEDTGYLAQFKEWKPRSLKPEFLPAQFKAVDQLENDILNAMYRSLNDLANPDVNLYMRPELIPEGIESPAGTAQKPGDVIHHY